MPEEWKLSFKLWIQEENTEGPFLRFQTQSQGSLSLYINQEQKLSIRFKTKSIDLQTISKKKITIKMWLLIEITLMKIGKTFELFWTIDQMLQENHLIEDFPGHPLTDVVVYTPKMNVQRQNKIKELYFGKEGKKSLLIFDVFLEYFKR